MLQLIKDQYKTGEPSLTLARGSPPSLACTCCPGPSPSWDKASISRQQSETGVKLQHLISHLQLAMINHHKGLPFKDCSKNSTFSSFKRIKDEVVNCCTIVRNQKIGCFSETKIMAFRNLPQKATFQETQNMATFQKTQNNLGQFSTTKKINRWSSE